MPRFAPHGRITAHVDGPIVCFEACGPFNAEAVEGLLRAYQPLIARLSGVGPFGHITVFHDSMLATPDGMEAFDLLLRDWRQQGILPCANAYVAGPDVVGRAVMMPLFSRLFTGPGPFRDFVAVDEAEAWIREVLAARR